MKQLFRFVAVYIFSVSFSTVFAAETVSWGEGTVTYSDSVHMALESATQTLNLSQFNAAAVAAEKGGSANEYTLTKVVFSINGSISGVVEFENESTSVAQGVSVYASDRNDPSGNKLVWSQVRYGGYSAVENYDPYKFFSTVGADSDVDPDWAGDDYGRFDVNDAGTGAASSADITSDLASYNGTGQLVTSVDFQGVWTAENLPNSVLRSDVYGDATVSVTYYYSGVPEPSTLALLGFGCAALLTRRRRKPSLDC